MCRFIRPALNTVEDEALVDADTVGLPMLQPRIMTGYAFASPCIPEKDTRPDSNRDLRAYTARRSSSLSYKNVCGEFFIPRASLCKSTPDQ